VLSVVVLVLGLRVLIYTPVSFETSFLTYAFMTSIAFDRNSWP